MTLAQQFAAYSEWREQLSRDPYPYPTLRFARTPDSIFDYTFDDIVLEGYQHHPAIRAAVAV